MFRVISGLLSGLFGLAVVLQYNDPDPLQWMAIYAAACGVSLAAAMHRPVPLTLVAAVGVLAFVWGLAVALKVGGPNAYLHMFDAWRMTTIGFEEARESSGLFVVAGWMAVVALSDMFDRRE